MGKYLLLIGLLLLTGILHAQSCPEGYEVTGGQGAYGCAPRPDNDSYNQQQQPQQQAPQAPPEQWADHWGAIATDFSHGSVGIAANTSNQNDAERIALADCQTKGGSICKVEIAYRNQCAVLVAGDTGHNTKAGATVADAIKAAMKVCSTADANCKTYRSTCSLPVRIQ